MSQTLILVSGSVREAYGSRPGFSISRDLVFDHLVRFFHEPEISRFR